MLSMLLNGDWQLDNTVQHWSRVPRDRTQVLQDMERFAIPALLPHTCPVVNRGSFLGHEAAFRWVALLALAHNLLDPVISRFCGHQLNKVPAEQLPTVPGRPSCESWARAVSRRTRIPPADPADETDAAVLVDEPAQGAAQQREDLTWDELKRATRRKAAIYARSNPGPTLLLALQALAPVQNLTRAFIQAHAFGRDILSYVVIIIITIRPSLYPSLYRPAQLRGHYPSTYFVCVFIHFEIDS